MWTTRWCRAPRRCTSAAGWPRATTSPIATCSDSSTRRPSFRCSARRTATTSPPAGARRSPSSRAARSTELVRARRGDLRRDHRRQDLARHPRAHPDASRRRPAGVADHRHALRARGDHRPPAGPDRRPGHRRRIGRRGLHRQAGRRHPARPRQGARGAVAGDPRGPQPQTLHRLLRQLQRRAHAVAGGHGGRHQSRRPAAQPGPRTGMGDPRLPHRPQGRPHRGAVGPGAGRGGRCAGGVWPRDANHADKLRR